MKVHNIEVIELDIPFPFYVESPNCWGSGKSINKVNKQTEACYPSVGFSCERDGVIFCERRTFDFRYDKMYFTEFLARQTELKKRFDELADEFVRQAKG